jgi:hypothetical protein
MVAQMKIVEGAYSDPVRDFSSFLDDWDSLRRGESTHFQIPLLGENREEEGF